MFCKVFLNILDTTDFINCMAKRKIGQDAILVSMDVAILCTNIPQEEGTEIVGKAYTIVYELFLNNDLPIPTLYLREMLGLILTDWNAFEFNGKNYLQAHGVSIGHKKKHFCEHLHFRDWNNPNPTKQYQAKIEESLHWWRFVPGDCNRKDVELFVKQIPFHNDVHGRNIREQSNFPWHDSFQRWVIHREIHLGH